MSEYALNQPYSSQHLIFAAGHPIHMTSKFQWRDICQKHTLCYNSLPGDWHGDWHDEAVAATVD